MEEKALKQLAKKISELLPLAEAAIYEFTAEERLELRRVAGDGTIHECSRLMIALSSETSRGMFLEGVTSKRVYLPFFEQLVRKPKR